MILPVDRDYVVGALIDLVRINSVNPELVSGAPGELEIGEYIAEKLKWLGLPTAVDEVAPGRINVTGTIHGTGRGRSLMLNAHMDTVGVEGMSEPFSGQLHDGKVYGRGAQDMKGSIAAIMGTLKALVESGVSLSGDLIATFVADEEYGSIGTEHVVEHLKTDAAIVAEPTDLSICLAHKGFWVFEFETIGRAAHGGCPDEGMDANLRMGRVLQELDVLAGKLRSRPPHPLVGAPSLHVPLVKGGDQLFIYAANCNLSVERRTVPGETRSHAVDEMASIVSCLKSDNPQLECSVRTVLGRDPYEISVDAAIVKLLSAVTKEVLGSEPAYVGHSWWEDAALFGEHGIETVIIGPRGVGIHSSEEWVEVESVVQLTEILTGTVMDFCR